MPASKWILLSSLAIACASSQTTAPANDRTSKGREFLGLAPSADPVAASRGQKLFVENCAFCHGQNATGAEGPDLVRSTVVLHDDKGETIGPVVLKGRPDRGMPAFPTFTADQIQDVAAFLHARVEAAANRWGYKVQNVVTGDVKQGQAFFAGQCASCHSPVGDLAHIASRFEPADLQAQFLYPSDPKTPTTAIVKSPTGERVEGTIKSLDDFTVSLIDTSGKYCSWPRNKVELQLNDSLAGHRKLLDSYSNQDMHNILAYLETLK